MIYLAIQALKARKSSYQNIAVVEASNEPQQNKSFAFELATGFMSGILNPKNLLFYLSLFTVVLTNEVSLGFKISLGVWMTSVVFLWDAAIVLLLSTPKIRTRFTKMAFYIDKLTGAILGIIGITIVKSAISR